MLLSVHYHSPWGNAVATAAHKNATSFGIQHQKATTDNFLVIRTLISVC